MPHHNFRQKNGNHEQISIRHSKDVWNAWLSSLQHLHCSTELAAMTAMEIYYIYHLGKTLSALLWF